MNYPDPVMRAPPIINDINIQHLIRVSQSAPIAQRETLALDGGASYYPKKWFCRAENNEDPKKYLTSPCPDELSYNRNYRDKKKTRFS
jgi:hypothetical protein